MTKTALITGASYGIGAEFARYHAQRGGDVIVTARSEDKLKTLAAALEAEYEIKAHVFAADLGTADGPAALIEKITAAGVQVDILINNAGFGGQGRHIDRPLADEQEMIDLNVKALVALSHHFGREMAKRAGPHLERRLLRRLHARPAAGSLFCDQSFCAKLLPSPRS